VIPQNLVLFSFVSIVLSLMIMKDILQTYVRLEKMTILV